MVKKLKNKKGFTLIEVMIAIAIFSIFVLTFNLGFSRGINISTEFRPTLKLRDFAQLKVNELLVNPPQLTEALTSAGIEKGKFEEDDNYEFEVEFQKIHIPDFSKIRGESEDDDGQSPGVEKKVFQVIKENMEKIVWQVRVKVTHTISAENYELTTWLINKKAKVTIKGL